MKYINSTEKQKDYFNENNHIQNLTNEELKLLYNLDDTLPVSNKGQEHYITSISDEKYKGKDIVLHNNGFWEPRIEYELRKEFLKDKNIKGYKFGYIAIPNEKGYKFWQSFDVKENKYYE